MVTGRVWEVTGTREYYVGIKDMMLVIRAQVLKIHYKRKRAGMAAVAGHLLAACRALSCDTPQL